jgi:hypothetical protein
MRLLAVPTPGSWTIVTISFDILRHVLVMLCCGETDTEKTLTPNMGFLDSTPNENVKMVYL